MAKPLCDLGKQIKFSLIDIGETQNWLIEQVKEKTGMYFDDAWKEI